MSQTQSQYRSAMANFMLKYQISFVLFNTIYQVNLTVKYGTNLKFVYNLYIS